MALNLITAPTPVAPAGLADYVAQNNLLEAGFLNTEQPLRVISGNIPESTVLQIGDAIYRADGDTAIGGVASDYVKITPAGATAAAAYVASLAGVTWNKTYSGYYDVGGNLYIFNESIALIDGEIATVQTRYLNIEEDGKVYIGNGLHFAADASIEWDESEDTFSINKPVLRIAEQVYSWTSVTTRDDFFIAVRTLYHTLPAIGAHKSIAIGGFWGTSDKPIYCINYGTETGAVNTDEIHIYYMNGATSSEANFNKSGSGVGTAGELVLI